MNSLESSPELGVYEFSDKVVKITVTPKKVLSELRWTIWEENDHLDNMLENIFKTEIKLSAII